MSKVFSSSFIASAFPDFGIISIDAPNDDCDLRGLVFTELRVGDIQGKMTVQIHRSGIAQPITALGNKQITNAYDPEDDGENQADVYYKASPNTEVSGLQLLHIESFDFVDGFFFEPIEPIGLIQGQLLRIHITNKIAKDAILNVAVIFEE